MNVYVTGAQLTAFKNSIWNYCSKTSYNICYLLTKAKKFVWQSSKLAPLVWKLGCVISDPLLRFLFTTQNYHCTSLPTPNRTRKPFIFTDIFTFLYKLQNGGDHETTRHTKISSVRMVGYQDYQSKISVSNLFTTYVL